MRRLVIASTNSGKLREIEAILDGVNGWRVEPLPEGLAAPDETGSTFVANAAEKAEFYSRQLGGGWVIADDSGLEVDALDGRPGVHSSRYAPSDAARNAKLLGELSGVGENDRTARFVCALALAKDGHTVWTTEGRVEGSVALEEAGDNGFGYDPLFHVPEFGVTMGQLPAGTKNRISHRGQALAALRRYLEQAHG